MINIKRTILIPIFASIFICLSIGSIIVARQLYGSYIEEAAAHLETTAHLKAQMIEYLLDDVEHELASLQKSTQFFAAMRLVEEADVTCNDHSPEEVCRGFFEELEQYFILNPYFVEMHVFGTEKQVLGHFMHAERNPHIFWRTEEDSVARLAHVEEKGKHQYFTDLEVNTAGHPSMAFVGTMADREGLAGFVVFELNVDLFDQILEDRIGLGETGETYFVGRDAVMRSNSRFFNRPTRLDVTVDTRNQQECFVGQRMTTDNHIFPDYRGEDVVGRHVYINRIDWCLLAEIDKQEALKSYYQEIYTICIIVLTILLVLYIVITFIAQKISSGVRIIQ